MARPPHNQGQSLGRTYLHYFLAPHRVVKIAKWVLILCAIRYVFVHPPEADAAVQKLLTLAIMVGAIWYFFIKPRLPKKKKKGDGH